MYLWTNYIQIQNLDMNVARLYRCHICRFYMAFVWQGGFNVHADIYYMSPDTNIVVLCIREILRYWNALKRFIRIRYTQRQVITILNKTTHCANILRFRKDTSWQITKKSIYYPWSDKFRNIISICTYFTTYTN